MNDRDSSSVGDSSSTAPATSPVIPRLPLTVEVTATGAQTVGVLVAVMLADLDALETTLVELLDEYIDACHQGSGNEPLSSPTWHNFMSTYEYADDLIPRAQALLGRALSSPPTLSTSPPIGQESDVR